MTNSGLDVVREARKLLRTPFHHQGRVPGVGLDCVGLAVAVANALGIDVQDTTDYPPETDGEALQAALESSCEVVKSGRESIGDLLQFKRGRAQWHVGILSALVPVRKMIHAKSRIGGGSVVEEPVSIAMRRRQVAAWRIVGLV